MQDTKLIFLDIDGTLNISGKNISRPVINALLQVQKNGHKFLLVLADYKALFLNQ